MSKSRCLAAMNAKQRPFHFEDFAHNLLGHTGAALRDAFRDLLQGCLRGQKVWVIMGAEETTTCDVLKGKPPIKMCTFVQFCSVCVLHGP